MLSLSLIVPTHGEFRPIDGPLRAMSTDLARQRDDAEIVAADDPCAAAIRVVQEPPVRGFHSEIVEIGRRAS